MKISYLLNDIAFEWQSSKATANLKKHRVSFEKACETFFDPFLKVEEGGVVAHEAREAIIGMTVDWRLLFVVYVVGDEVVKLISARDVTSSERKEYEAQ